MLENEYVFVCRFLAHPSLYTWDSKLDMSRPKLQQFYSALWTQMTYVKELPLMVPEQTTHCMKEKKTVSPQAVPKEWCDEIKWNKRVATGGARTSTKVCQALSKVCMLYVHKWLAAVAMFFHSANDSHGSVNRNYFKASDDCIYFPQFHLPAVTQNTCPCNILACCLSYTPTYVTALGELG